MWIAQKLCYVHVKSLFTLLLNLTFLFIVQLITRRRSWSFAEYCKHFVTRLNDVHAFGYNSAGSERIWVKFGQLQVYGLELTWQILGAIRAEAAAGARAKILFFLSIKQKILKVKSFYFYSLVKTMVFT